MSDHIVEIPLEHLHDSPTNPRTHYSETYLQELGANIKRVGRILQPLLVRPRIPALFAGTDDPNAIAGWEIVFGHCRKRGGEIAELTTAPCMVRSMTDAEVLVAQISENLQRKDVHPIEEAQGFQALIDTNNDTADLLAERFGKSRSYVYGRLKLLQAVPAVRNACLAGEVDAEVTLLIARLRHPKLQERALGYIKGKYIDLKDGGKRSYRQVKDLLNEHFTLNLDKAPFPIEEEMLLPAAGNCVLCPKRSGNAPEYADIVSDKNEAYQHRKVGPDVCTDPECFQQKKVAFFRRKADDLRAKGKVVVDGNKARAAIDAYGKVKGAYVALSAARTEVAEARRTAQRDPKIPPPLIVTIQDPRTGKTVEAVPIADLKVAGALRDEPKGGGRSPQRDYEAERREDEAKTEVEAQRRKALFTRVREAIRHQPRTADEARVVAHFLVQQSRHGDDDVTVELADLWGVARQGMGAADPWPDALAKMTRDDLALLMLDSIMILLTSPSRWNLDEGPEYLYAIAKLHDIPLGTVGADTPSPAAQAQEDDATEEDSTGAWPADGLDAMGQPLADWKSGEQKDNAGCAGESGAEESALFDSREAA